jgi:hypothetical protein
MKRGFIKLPVTFLHGFVALFFATTAFKIYLQQSLSSYLFYLPAALHPLFSFVGSLLALRFSDNSRNEIERTILPILYLCFTFLNIPTLTTAMLLNTNYFFSLNFLGTIYIFALIFALVLLLLMGLFHFGINKGKLAQFIVLSALASLLVALTLPLSIATNPFESSLWVGSSFYFMLLILTIIAAITFITIFLRDRNSYTFIRVISLLTVSSGSIFYVYRPSLVVTYLGLVLFIGGTLIGMPRERLTQLQ